MGHIADRCFQPGVCMPSFSEEQVLALAPDESSAKSGRELAASGKWVSWGASDLAVWGECQGSGAKPYQTCVDNREAAFKCSCPSRKFPCKHGLGLLLFLARDAKSFAGKSDAPDWVEQWLNNRHEKAEKKQKKKEEAVQAPVDPVAKAKRQSERLAKVQSGINDFSLWLQDRIRQGLAGLESESYQYWETQAARLTDAQAPGLARMLRQCAGIPYSGEGWQERLLERLALMHLALEGFQRIDELPELQQQDLRNVIGYTVSQEEVLQQTPVKDRWQILAQRVDVEERLKTQRTWMRAESSGRWALILSFAHGMQPLDLSLTPGSSLEAELCFFPASYPLRALVKAKGDTADSIKAFNACKSADEFLDGYTGALSCNPFLESYPMALQNVQAFVSDSSFLLVDADNSVLPPIFAAASLQWQILAISGGNKFDLFAEYSLGKLLPLSMMIDGNFYRLDQRLKENVA